MGSGDGNFSVEYIKFDWLGSGDLDLRSVLKLYVRDANFFDEIGSSLMSEISNESLRLDMTGLISIEIDNILLHIVQQIGGF